LADLSDRYRTAKEAWEREFVWYPTCDKLETPRGSVVHGEYDLESKTTNRWIKDPDGNKIEGSEKLVKPFRDSWSELEKRMPGFTSHELPPQVPDCLALKIGYYTKGMGEGYAWTPWVSAEMTKDIPVPQDPRRRRHDELFQKVFAEVRGNGFVLRDMKEIPNQYFKDTNDIEPWYTFRQGKSKFLVGPRKRVYHISVTAPKFKLVHHQKVTKELGQRDNVTWEASGKTALIHAWGRDKLVEYLTALLK